MKMLRILLVVLLCAVLPLSGLAASGLTGQCPMQAGMANDDGSTMSTEVPDCDAMKSPSANKAKNSLCKAMTQCQMGSLYHPGSKPVVHRPAGHFSPVFFHYAQALIVRTPDGLWRPPRTL
jgi:hypothetical protein